MRYKDDIKLFTWVGVLSGVFAALLLVMGTGSLLARKLI